MGAWLLALAAPLPEQSPGALPRDVSRYGHEIDRLLHVTGVFTLILFAVMVGWMLWACLRHGRKHEAVHDHGDQPRSIKWALALSAVTFLIVDGNLWVDSTLDVNRIFWNHAWAEGRPDALRVEVNARQWVWEFRYPGADGVFATPAGRSPDDVVLTGELVVPVDVPIVLQLGSTDVIHSFYLPNFRVKIDAVPGTITRLWFEATTPGEYDIACAQHCGVAHYKMRAVLRVLSRDDFARWKAGAEASAPLRNDPNDAPAHWGWTWPAGQR